MKEIRMEMIFTFDESKVSTEEKQITDKFYNLFNNIKDVFDDIKGSQIEVIVDNNLSEHSFLNHIYYCPDCRKTYMEKKEEISNE